MLDSWSACAQCSACRRIMVRVCLRHINGAAIVIQRCARKKRDVMRSDPESETTEPQQSRMTTTTTVAIPPSSIPLPLTKQQLHGGNNGVGPDTGDTADDTSFQVTGNDAAAASSPLSPSVGEEKKHPVDADNSSSCSNRSTDAPSSRPVKEAVVLR